MAVNYREPSNLIELLAQLKENGVDASNYVKYVDIFMDSKARKQGVPLEGKFELTPLCNLDCKMCYVHLNKEQMAGTQLMSVEKWIDLATQAVDLGMKEVILTGGECLTYPDFEKLYLQLQSLGVEIQVYTNGLLLDEKRIEFLKKHSVKRIQLSLYGCSEDGYEKVTGHRCFAKVLKNLCRVKEAKLPLHLAITPSIYMKDEVEDLLRFTHSLELPYSVNSGLFEPRESTGRKGKNMDLSVDEYIKLYKLQSELYGKQCRRVSEKELISMENRKTGTRKGLPCGGGRSGFSIGYDGKMYICGIMRDTVAYPLKTGFAKAWKIINESAENVPYPSECEDCVYRKACPICVLNHRIDGVCSRANPKMCERAKRLVQEGIVIVETT